MNTLSIDIGNNKIKLDFWDNDGIQFQSVSDVLPIEYIKERVEGVGIKGIIVSSVRKDYREILESLKENSGCDLIVDFNRAAIEKYSDKIKYNGKVGVDRIAAYLGAQSQYSGPKLIIDAGTAITLDVVDKGGNYCGGNISLGYRSRINALAKATSLLPEVKKFKASSFLGNDTESAIVAGAKNGVLGEILYTIKLARKEYGIEKVFITGGDSDYFLWQVWNEWKQCIPDKHLVGRGLNYHLRKFYFPDVFFHTKFQQSI